MSVSITDYPCKILAMSKLLKQISESDYGKWILYGIIGVATVSIFPKFPLGWIFLNIVAIYFINIIAIILHEIGHIVASIFMGMTVYKVVIGSGINIIEFQIFGVLFKINNIGAGRTGGQTYALLKSTYFYRSRTFVYYLCGILTNLGLIYLVLQFPRKIVTGSLPGTYIFPGTIFCISNAVLAIGNLLPRRVVVDGIQVYTDGFQLMKTPFLSKQDINENVSTSWLINGYNLERSGKYQKAIESFGKSLEYNPDCAQAYQQRGNTYRSMKDEHQAIDNYQQAIDYLSHTIELDHQNVTYYYLRATVYQDWMKIDPNKSQNAIEDFQMAESLCLEHGNTSLLQQVRQELEKIST
jgi:tetratricopeptide (TPR) repeat protein